jgi:GAF domain-containing protein
MAQRQGARPKTRAAKRPAKPAVDLLKDETAGLKRDLRERSAELARALEQQTASSEENTRLRAELAKAAEFHAATGKVLRIVASSPDDLQSVFDAMLEKATELCQATYGFLVLYDGYAYRMAAGRNLPPALADALRAGPHRPGPNTALGRVARTKAHVHMDDVRKDIAYIERDPRRVAAVESGGARTQLAVPLLKKGELIGAFIIYRQEPVGFAENQIALVTTFADQAVIAIENARLFEELQQRTRDLSESLEQQTATAEVLQVINASPGDLGPVFDAMLDKALGLCGAQEGRSHAPGRRRSGRCEHDPVCPPVG